MTRIGAFRACIYIATASSIFCSVPSESAKIEPAKLDGSTTAIFVIGDIVPGDDITFKSLAAKYDRAVVFLESEGGSVATAIEIGEAIRLKGYATTVVNDSFCNSSCALIWLAGSPRELSKSGRVGFHAAYANIGGEAKESGAANAMVGRYLTLLNLPSRAVVFATTAPPSQLNYLTAKNYASSGIDLAIVDDLDLSDTGSGSDKKPAGAAPSPPPIVTVTSPPVANASNDASVWRKSPYWTVYVDDSLADGCFLLGSFGNSTVLRIGIDRRSAGQYYVLFGNADWKSLQVGQRYDLQLQFDRNSPWDVPTTAKTMGSTVLLWANFKDSTFWNEFSSSQTLNVTRQGKAVTALRFQGTKAAFADLVACQRYQDAKSRSRDPFAD